MRKNRTTTTAAEKSFFTKEEQHYLGHYVYRLVDPRNGQTFYIGKGTGNRVFDHMNGLSPEKWSDDSEDEIPTEKSAKMATIKAIRRAGLHVTCFIHRHDMDEDVAYEVEAALIDAYGALTNIQKGHGFKTQGCMSVLQVEKNAKAPEAVFGKREQFVIIKVRPETVAAHNGNIYAAVRGNWVIDPDTASGLPILACVEGVIQKVYVHCKWRKAPMGKGKNRWCFEGKESKELTTKYKGKKLPKTFREKHQANPIRYVNVNPLYRPPRKDVIK